MKARSFFDRMSAKTVSDLFQARLREEYRLPPAAVRTLGEELRRYAQLLDQSGRRDGQIVFQAIALGEPPGKPLSECRKVPVRLTLFAPVDLDRWQDHGRQTQLQGHALFDTGAVYSYVCANLVAEAPCTRLARPVRVALAGQSIEITELCLLNGQIEGLDFVTDAVPVRELGHADGHELGMIVGARTMEQWQIRFDPSTGALDLEGLRKREFTEF